MREIVELDVAPETTRSELNVAPPVRERESAAGPEDQLRVYLLEIGRTPLLTAEEEIALGSALERGRKAEDRLRDVESTASKDEIRQMEAEVRMGEMARARLIESNLRLVVSIAKRYMGRGLTLSDLIQEGNIGLMRAADKYDWRRGLRFSTYATWWVRHAITRAVAEQGRLIRLPVHLVESLVKVQRTQYRLLQELGRDPTIGEIAERAALPPTRVEEVLKSSPEPVSLETPISEDATTLGDLLPDEAEESPGEQTSRHMLKDELLAYLETLTAQEKQVLELRFGLRDGNQRTLEQVGAMMGLTRERIRQIEAKALRRLRNSTTLERFGGYLR